MIDNYMDEAFREAFKSVRDNIGGPFGAVVVKDGNIVGKGGNRVSSENDPTAHAEVVAIRDACKNLGTFDLSGAEIYTTCEPCPMCFSAIYWASIDRVFYCSTRHEAESIGFRDNHIYEELDRPIDQRITRFQQVNHPLAARLFSEWREKTDKIPY
ncbi:MAG TPA: nucleoside deaminase [Bacteroidales bacterium]|nr:nucleoside deaminase [Bacteroidales bacterium]HPS63555.1 nucleoside deaminase [Bacteroidales bacterium]